MTVDLHHALDFAYGEDGDARLKAALAAGADPNSRSGDGRETLLHVAVRRRRLSATQILVSHGAALNATNASGKTAYAHAIRRGFQEVAEYLQRQGADTRLNGADRFAVAVVDGDLDAARRLLAADPRVARTGNPAEDRLLADVAGRADAEPVRFLIEAGADLNSPALDDGGPLHQAAWFGQPRNARLLVEAGAALNRFDRVHQSSPLGWAVHGSRFSTGAAENQAAYCELVRLLLAAGSTLCYPNQHDSSYLERLRGDAPPWILELLPMSVG